MNNLDLKNEVLAVTLIERVDLRRAFLSQNAGPHSGFGDAHHANDPGSSDLLHPTENPMQHRLHCLLIEAAEEIKIDWPGFFDWKLSAIVSKLVLAACLVAALVSFSILSWHGLSYFLNAAWFPALK